MNTFKQGLDRLNTFQQEAVETIEGPVMVIAGPGTGKTQTLTLRIANILAKTQMNPENILALTFTDAAVHEMRQRLIKLIGNEAYRLSIYTFHGFSNQVIQIFDEEFEELLGAKPISELEQIQGIEKLLTENKYKLIKPLSSPLFFGRTIVGQINQLKREQVSPKKLEDAVNKDEQEFNNTQGKFHEKGRYKGKMKGEFQTWEKRIHKNRELIDIYIKYEAYLQSAQLFDFNDMILKVVNLLSSNQEILQQLQERYQYILVDEHQDTNTSQNNLIELIASYYENPNLFIVGDEKQAIFRFQGASLENFLYFKERYPTAVLINLQENYRSSQTILDATHTLIAHSAIELPSLAHKLQARSNRENVPVRVAELDNYFAEYAYVVHEIKEKIQAGISPKEIAAICRTNKDLFELAHSLEQENVPFMIDSDQNILEDLQIEKLLILLQSVANLPVDAIIAKAMHLDFIDLYPIDTFRVICFARDNRLTVWETLENLAKYPTLELKERESMERFFKLLHQWKIYSENNRLDDTLVRIINESGFIKYIMKHKQKFDIIDKLTRLFQEIRIHVYDRSDYSLSEFLEYISLLRTHRLALKSKHITGSQEAVQLITAHKAKGREFDYVYILNAFDGHWGSTRTRAKQFAIPWNHLGISRTPEEKNVEIEDERRLFYVALTRARYGITITYSNHGLEGKEQVPCLFISEIHSDFIKIADTVPFAHEFEKNKVQIFATPRRISAKDTFFANKPFFLERLKRLGLSVTALNNYLECPWKYFFRNLIQIPEEKSVAQLFGTSIHVAFNKYIDQRKKGVDSFEVLINAFQKAIEEQPLLAEELDLWKERGVNALTGYYQERISTWSENIESEVNIPGIHYKEDLFLSGKIDMLQINTTENDVIVYDFKTGKPKSRNFIEGKSGQSNGEYKRQLVFYNLLLDTYRNGFYKMAGGVIDFVEPTESNAYKSEYFEISEEEMHKLKQEIELFHEDMHTLAFWNKECDDKACEYCKLRRFMSDEV